MTKPNYHIIQMAGYTSPAIVEKNNKDWVEYGDMNDYFQYLIDLFYSSPTNNACIKGKADMVFGYGPEVVRGDRHLKGYLDFKILFQDEDVRKVTMDLCLLGMAAFQIVKSKDGKKYIRAYHFPMQTLRPQKANDKGEIEKWYYCADWSKLKKSEKPQEFAAFGYDENAKESILVIKPYSTGNFYFTPPDWQGGSQYCELEGEISNYHINGIKNGLAPSMLINFNNGEPPQETKDAIEASINHKFGGSSNTGRAIVSFNDSKDNSADITPVVLSDLPQQYQFLSTECTDKILLAHRITSPLIFGVKNTGNGFSSNADELKTATILFDNLVIRPIQRLVIETFNKVLLANEVTLDIYFKTLQPLEFIDLGGQVLDQATKEKEIALSKYDQCPIATQDIPTNLANRQTAIDKAWYGPLNPSLPSEEYWQNKADHFNSTIEEAKSARCGNCSFFNVSKAIEKCIAIGIGDEAGDPYAVIDAGKLGYCEAFDFKCASQRTCDAWVVGGPVEMSSHDEDQWLEHLQGKGEVVDMSEWVEVDCREATQEDEMLQLAYDNPDLKSKDDKGIFKIRYRYGPSANSPNSRKFCVDMVALTRQGIVYRREDINQMSFSGVNGQFAPSGRSTYSIWKFKGGVNCHHAWYRVTYLRRSVRGKIKPLTSAEKGTDIREMENYAPISNAKANVEGVPFSPPNWNDAKTKPIDMPNKGSLKNK